MLNDLNMFFFTYLMHI